MKAKRGRRLAQTKRNSRLEVVLDERKNRHICRLLLTLGVNVLRWVRAAIGPVELRNFPKGGVWHLTEAEQLSLIKAGEKD